MKKITKRPDDESATPAKDPEDAQFSITFSIPPRQFNSLLAAILLVLL